MKVKELRTHELSNAYEFLYNFDSDSQYQQTLKFVLDTLDFALTRLDSMRENYDILFNLHYGLLDKNKSKTPEER
jgi:hypothetical protein